MHALVSLVISTSSLYFILTDNINLFILLLSFVFIFDMFGSKVDMVIHHAIFFNLLLVSLLYQLNMPPNFYRDFLKVEISTIFLSLYKLVPRGKIRTLSQYLFVFTFTKYRMINLFYLLSNDQYNQAIVQQMSNDYVLYFVYANLYGFYLLNLYWYGLILNILWCKLRGLKN